MRRKAERGADSGEGKSTFGKVLKWAGGITALLSLLFGLQQFTQMLSDARERRRTTDELYRVGKLQQSSADYAAAWASFEQGMQAAEPGGQWAKLTGQLNQQRRRLREAQEDLAMEWLENIRASSERGETFTQIIAPLAPILTRGVTANSGARRADLLAHLGWADFLRWRDGQRELDPARQYRAALSADSLNPYAHAYLAHWLLWTGQARALPDARSHFEAALRSGRARPKVRRTQLAAFMNMYERGEEDLLRTITEMRRGREPVDEQFARALRNLYTHACGKLWRDYDHEGTLAMMRAAIPAEEHVANIDFLLRAQGADALQQLSHDACRATLLESYGRNQEALLIWRTVKPAEQRTATWSAYGVAAIGRLGGRP
jgi:hypothetical protein